MHKNTIIPFRIRVSILIKNEDYYMNTIGNMQNEKYFYNHYKKFEYNQDYVK